MGKFRTFRKLFFNLPWIVITAGFIILITLAVLSRKYKEELQEITLSRINQSLDTKIHIEKIDVSFFKTFPYLSLVFNNMVASSSSSFNQLEFRQNAIDTDTLFTAENLYLQFNPVDLIRSKTRIRRIYAVNGKLNMLIDSKGKTNFDILKKEPEAKKEQNQNQRVFELEILRLSNFNVIFNNLAKKTYSSSLIENILLKGKFSKSEFYLGTNTSLKLYDFTRNGFRYANHYDLHLRLIMDVKDSIAEIKRGEINLNTIKMDTRGVLNIGKNPDLNLNMESRNINIATLLSSFPADWRNNLPFDADGRGDLAVKVQGMITPTSMPSVDAVYVLRIDQVRFQEDALRNIRLRGKYSNGNRQSPSSTTIEIEKYRIADRNSDLEGSLTIQNLVNPLIELEMHGHADASKLSDLIFRDQDIRLQGRLNPDLIFRTRARSFKNLKMDMLSSAGLSGDLNIMDLSFESREIKNLNNINGKISFAGDTWFPELNVNFKEIDLGLKAQMDYVLAYLTGEDQVLMVNALLKAEKLDLREILQVQDDSEAQGSKGFFLPDRIVGKLQFEFKEFNTKTTHATNLKGQLGIADKQLVLNSLNMNTMDGLIKTNAVVVQNDLGDFYMASENSLEHIDINQMFTAFNNFGQDDLKAENLRGFLSGSIAFNAVFDSTLNIMKDKIFTEADILIRSGELIDFEPVERLSGFTGLKELEHIRFSELKNSVLIKNNSMTIPEMDIKSNAFSITASGKHDFNGLFDYKLKILMSEILTGKAKSKNQEYFVMEDERRASLHLSISGTAEDYKIKYDKAEAIASVKEDLKKEKTTLKTILNEEFGWFKKDSLSNQQKSEEPTFILDWDDDSISTPDRRRKDRIKKKSGKKADEEIFQLEWDEDDG